MNLEGPTVNLQIRNSRGLLERRRGLLLMNIDDFSYIPVFVLFQVTDIWYSHLYNIVKVRTRTPATPKGVGPLIVEMFDEQEDSLGKFYHFGDFHSGLSSI